MPARVKPRTMRSGSVRDGRVDLVQELLAILEVEVLRQVMVGLLARSAVQRHVQSDQASALDVLGKRLGHGLGDSGLGDEVDRDFGRQPLRGGRCSDVSGKRAS